MILLIFMIILIGGRNSLGNLWSEPGFQLAVDKTEIISDSAQHPQNTAGQVPTTKYSLKTELQRPRRPSRYFQFQLLEEPPPSNTSGLFQQWFASIIHSPA